MRCRRQQIWTVEKRKYSRFTFVENTSSNSSKVPRAKFMRSDRLFCFNCICKLGTFKNTFAIITSLSELYFRFRRFILLVQTKELFSVNYGRSPSSWKPCRWVKLDLIDTMRDITHQFQSELHHKAHQQQQKHRIWRYPPMKHLSMITKTIPISTRIVISYVMKRDIPFWVWQKVNGNWDNNMISFSMEVQSL